MAPVWKTQPWYPTVLEMCKDFPLLIPQGRNLIKPTHPQSMLDVVPQLAVWNISGDNTKSNNFQRKLQSSCSHHGERNPLRHMTHSSRNGLAGAVKGVQVPFHALVNFLADLFLGYQYRSLNAYRSAISLVHDKVDGYVLVNIR